MSIWIWMVALLPPILFAVSNLVDKKIVHGDTDEYNPWSIIALGAVFDIVVCIPIGVYCLTTGNLPSVAMFWPLFVNGITFTVAAWIFYVCLKTEDTSRVVPIFQTVPAFGIFLGLYGLQEVLSLGIFLGIILLMIGGYVLSVKKGKINKRILAMMLLSSALYAINDFVLARYGREVLDGVSTVNGFWASTKVAMPVIFADLLGKIFFGIIILISPKVRTNFALGFKSKFGLVAASSLTYTLGDIGFDIAKIFAPLALVQALCCTQPLFVLIGAVGLTIFCKSFPKEEADGKSLGQKVFGVVMMVIGGILLSI